MPPSWRIELFGGVRAVRDGTVVNRFRTQKTASLLALLAARPGRGFSRDELIERFWPDDDLPAARHKLSVALSALRQQLEAPGTPEGAVLRADRFTVSLAPEAVATDVAEFEAALAAAERAAADADPLAHLARAVELYRGEFLAGLYDAWIFPEQQRLSELFVRALARLVALRERAGDREGALQAALRAIAADPLREEPYLEAMRLQLAAGRPALALRQYRELEKRLRDDLDAAPSPAVRELARAAQAAMEEPEAPELPPAPVRPDDLEPPGGAVPLHSRFYVERATDAQFRAAIERGDSIVLVKGPRQVGKTSLLARGLQRARESGAAVALTDFQGLNADHLASAETLLLALAEDLHEQLDLDAGPRDGWDPRRGPSPNFRRYLRREVLSTVPGPLVWGLDEVDRLFQFPFATEVFGLFRSWHNERALDPSGPWSRLTLAIAYATEAHLFITDLNQSPFNVGTRLRLADFDPEHVADLNRRYGSPLRSAGELARFQAVLGGHPYLVRCGLHALATGRSLDQLESEAEQDDGLFSEHLRRIVLLLRRDPELSDVVRGLLGGRGGMAAEAFYRLRSAGLLTGDAGGEARFRCRLYERFLARCLL
jgi:DNA-binding SARP family transcriptional activator